MARVLVLLVFVFGLLAAPPGRAASNDLLPFTATEKTLPNGLKVVIVPTGLPNLVTVQIPVQTGSRNEVEPGKTGFAHFFEHMMFRGTKAYPAGRYNDILKKAGASENAYTTDDYTNYHVTFAKEDLETVLKLQADRFQNLAYSEDDFKTESRAVLGEYNKNSANPLSKLFEVQRDAAYRVHTYKHTTMGFLHDIQDMPNQYAYSQQFFQRWYRPEYTTVIIAGDVQPAQAMALVQRYWGGWKRGSFKASVPAEPAPRGAAYRQVPWPVPTLPWVTVAFHAPRFSDTAKDQGALALLLSLSFGPTSALYKRLVEDGQLVDSMFHFLPDRVDPTLATIAARVKNPADVVAVRDAILQTAARLRDEPVNPRLLADAKSSGKYGLIGSLDNTEEIGQTLARYAHFDRSYGTLNRYHRMLDTLTPDDLRSVARKVLVDEGMVVVALSHEALPPEMATLPPLAGLQAQAQAQAGAAPIAVLLQPSLLPQIRFKLLFSAGSAHDPPGKEGLAALAAAMVADAGSAERRLDEIKQALFPWAATFSAQVDKEMTVFTGSVHRERWAGFLDVALPMLLSPGLREDDFRRVKEAQANALRVDLKGNNEEEFAKERLQTNVYAGTPYGHPVLGTAKGIAAITLDDVKAFQRSAYAQGALRVGVSGAASDAMVSQLRLALSRLPAGNGLAATPVPAGRMPQGLEVEILQKETRATAISFGLPITVTRSHPDFAALLLARSWLGEHRNSTAHLYQRIREERGMNYGDYAYIEAFPRAMDETLAQPNVARKAQLFEVWLRPVTSNENAHLALRIALTELDNMVQQGLTQQQFEATRDFLMKYVYLMTATQDGQLGYALDAQWYGTAEYTALVRGALSRLTCDDVNAAIKRHLSATKLSVVIVTKDAADMQARLIGDTVSAITYDGVKSAALLAEDKVIGARKLGIAAQAVKVTPAEQVFAE